MTSTKFPGSASGGAVLLGLLLVVAAPAWAHDPAEEMAAAANRWLASLTAEQKTRASFDFGHADRQGWHFVPDRFIKPRGRRLGVKIGDMNSQQRLLAQALVSTGLSAHGYRQSRVIMSLEQVLHDLENRNPIRNPDLYYLSIFGKPSATDTWAWRFEGHHLSLNFTLVKGKQVSVTPSFFGANPGAVRQGAMTGLRVLHDEEDLARKLVKSLNPQQAKLAVIQAKAPRDIITGQNRRADRGAFSPPQGIAYARLGAEQQDLVMRIVRVYTSKYRPHVLEDIAKRKRIFGTEGVFFAWAGSLEVGQGHYYRIQTPHFLFEYDNTQNGANHVHAVWRDFDGDFGEDLLRKHHEAAHKAKSP